MKLTNPNDVPVYTISGASTARPLPDWLARQRKRSLKNDPEYANRVELLQDFEFEEASACIRVSEDGEWVMSTGTYKPQIHTHYLPHLSLSFARHTTTLNHSFILLSSDYSKSLHLQTDRKLEFHTPGGCHYETRLPRYGRDLIYDKQSAEALVPAVGVNADGSGEVYRLNLEVGRYMKPYQIDVGGDDMTTSGGGALQGGINTGSVNCAAIAEDSHNLLAFGTSIGTVEFWDPRSKARVGILAGQEGEITALDFDRSGLSLATGSSEGLVQLFDLRRPVPILHKDQGYGYPIKTLMHMTTSSQEKKILSADKRIIKLWDEADGKAWTSVEPAVDINSVAWCKQSGMILTANEGKQQHAFFIPQLGPAPRWCSFLDNMVEEMAEEAPAETYDNYKFLTLPELKSLNLGHLVGTTNLLRPYMHGYFVASKLYEEARLIANPYIFDDERTKRVKEKVEKERASRIRGGKKVKVNQNLVDKMLKRQERRQTVDQDKGVLGDDRFGKMFEDEEFAVDERSREFQALNPSTKVGEAGMARPSNISGESSDEVDDDDDEIAKVRKEKPKPEMRISSSSYKKSGHQSRDKSLGSRSQGNGRATKSRGEVVGERSVSFVPSAGKKEKEQPKPERKGRRDDGRRSASGNVFRRL
ncbi:Putative isomerase YbhE [Glarea lozoyensis ATCC 20868]|uniref:Putative isomerase YbhE n=1 Tax=Glarea lozoyensis (strain ATCC 20868 / MF5171) TaxID=1116229 RepID=S3CI01_GLAL2|nr:Putative isomerase YbhE [Glarea lozoyensis ATCC 20868]EPE25480.1 Putative isomerase YbhE [Glarea lozoyensis ATCC 20868]